MDALFLRQVWAGNEAKLFELLDDRSPVGQARLRYFLINKGPWSRLDHNRPFLPGVPVGQARGGQLLSGRRDQGRGRALDWHAAGGRAGQGARLLHDDPAHAAGQRRRRFSWCPTASSTRASSAQAARSAARGRGPDDAADAEAVSSRRGPPRSSATTTTTPTSPGWSSTPASSRPSARTRSTKTSGSTTRRPSRRSSRCATTPRPPSCRSSAPQLQDIENHLPIDPALRNPSLGALAPIRVVNVVFTAGDGNRGVQTAAFNLPNDERVIREKGSKRVMLKNVQEAKFRMVLQPIAEVALAPADRAKVSFDAFFTHILMHELMHGLGPHDIVVGGAQDDGAAGAEGDLQRHRGSQGRHLGLVVAALPRRQGRGAGRDRRLAVRHVPGIGLPVDPLRDHRGARPRHRDSVELPARQGRRGRRAPTARSRSRPARCAAPWSR